MSINCSTCEETIRGISFLSLENIPKGFREFAKFVKYSQEDIASKNYFELYDGLSISKDRRDFGCFPVLHLAAPQKQNDWRIITSYFASVCYAIFTRGMTYT